jgi:phage-related baseplate assembly protein
MSTRFGTFDPTQLGNMQAVVPSDEEDILRRRMTDFKAQWMSRDPPMGAGYDVDTVEFDPAKITMEVGTSYQMNVEARINQAAKDTTLAFAFGSNLDAIATRYPGGVPRLNKGLVNEETDERYRRRIWLAASGFSTAGAADAYVFWALTAVPELKDATATVERTRDGPTVVVTCLQDGPDPLPTVQQLLTVRAVLHRPDIKPLTDVISVRAPAFVDVTYDADVFLYPGWDEATVMKALQDRLAAYLVDLNWLGMDHTMLGFNGALARPEVHSAVFRGPLTDIIVDDTQAVRVLGTPRLVMKGRKE